MYHYKKNENKKLKDVMTIIGIMILTSIVTILLYRLYAGIEIHTDDATSGVTGTKMVQYVNNVKEESKQVADTVEEATKSVVGISKIKDAGSSIFLNDGASKLGLGTGVIVSENGYILSNEHVTGSKYSNCYVTLEDGRNYQANVVWSDTNIDLSICKISAKNLPFAKLGDSDNVRVGEKVYAIGNPIGYEFQRTVTAGIISAINRTIKIEENEASNYMEDLIQTDATINPGNSGGPLINPDGEMLGITSVKITSAEGIGFAVPINIVKPIIEKFMKEGKFDEAKLGIFAYDTEIIPYVDANAEKNLKKGIYVAQIALDSPAATSGLRVGDIIIKIDNLELDRMSKLRAYIYTKAPKDTVTLTVIRKNTTQEIQITLSPA